MNPYIGMQLGAYRLLEQIGRGGMATIFKAYQPSMDRDVAIKVLPGHFTEDKTFVARFTQEARTLAQLEHPHILPVHDYGEQEGITYLVMRYIDAGTLKDMITQHGPLALPEAARILDQVGRALDYAHNQGVVHRDIKPTNVLIDEQGNAFLTDFGIAKLVAGTSQFTATGAIVGTPAYMSPEQGLADPVDHRSDIYSLGVVLYEMVTGRVPFEAETPLAVLLKHINAPLPPPRQVKPDLPEEVERVILKAMAKSPDDRFQRTEEMVEALHRGLTQMPTEFALPRPMVEVADVTDVPLVEPPTITVPPPEPGATPAPRAPVSDRAVAAPRGKSLPWLPIAGGVAALAVLLIAALLILPNLGGGASEATVTAPEAGGQAQATQTSVEPGSTQPLATSEILLADDQRRIVLQQGSSPDRSYAGNADTILRSDFPAVNVGGETHLEVFWGEGKGQSLIRWDLSALPSGVTVDAASLELYRFDGEVEGDMEIALYRVTRDWAEGSSTAGFYPPPEYVIDGATWLSATASAAWAIPGGDYDDTTDYGHGPNGILGRATLPAGMDEGWIHIDATAAVRAWVEGGLPNYGLLLQPNNHGGYHYFHSRDHDVTELRPRLVVIYAEGPSTAGPVLDPGQRTPGWTNYTSGNFVGALARQEDYLWAGGSGGLVLWDLNDGSYVKFGVADGLASNEINDLLVDADGLLWVATEAGLNRFDGNTWLTFDHTDGLDSDEVEALLLDNDGALWTGTDGGEQGLNYYDGTGWGPPPVPALPIAFPTVRHLSMERNYGLWASLGAEGLGYFDGVAWSLASEEGLPKDNVYAMHLTENDELWVSFSGAVLRRDAETGEWETIPQLADHEVFAIHQAKDGSFWFGIDGGVMRYDPATGDWQAIEPRSGQIPDEWLTSIIEDEFGLWLGTDGGGVAFFDGEDWEALTTDDGLGGNDIFAIGQDGSGALWFTHPGDGLSRYDPATETWQSFGEEQGALDWPYHLGVDADGYVWIGGYEQLRWYDGRAWQSFAPDQLAGLGTIFDADFDSGGVQWFRTDTGLVHHDPTTDEWRVFTADDHPAFEDIHQLFVASDDTIWVGGDNGLAYYDAGERDAGGGDGWRAPDAPGDAPEKDVEEIAEAPDGSLWVVADGALYHLDEAGWRRFTRPDGGWIETSAVGPDGTVWVGSDGLGRFDPLNGNWQTLTTEDGLVNDSVRAIYVTPGGVVWVGTEAGVSRYVPEE